MPESKACTIKECHEHNCTVPQNSTELMGSVRVASRFLATGSKVFMLHAERERESGRLSLVHCSQLSKTLRQRNFKHAPHLFLAVKASGGDKNRPLHEQQNHMADFRADAAEERQQHG